MIRKLLTALSSVFILLSATHAIRGEVQKQRMMIIAHRGGVVDEERSENSLKALEEAIRRVYTHVEVDARLTKDGGVVAFHSNNMKDEKECPRCTFPGSKSRVSNSGSDGMNRRAPESMKPTRFL